MKKRLLVGCIALALFLSGMSYAWAATSSSFTRTLKLHSVGSDVQALQKYLNDHHFLVASKGPGSPGHETTYFGPGTRAALKAFQEFHLSDLLLPAGLKKGTGIFATVTRDFINKTLALPPAAKRADAPSSAAPRRYRIGGSITGVTGPITLENNTGDEVLIRPGDSSRFAFSQSLADGAPYTVRVKQAPSGVHCFDSSQDRALAITGTIKGDDVNNLLIQCTQERNPFQLSSGGTSGGSGGGSTPSLAFTVGGTLVQLHAPLVLQLGEGSTTLAVSSSGDFHFSTPFTEGQSYTVSILTQPDGQMCTVSDGSGVVGTANVHSVTVTCLTIPVIHTTNILVENALISASISPALSSYVSSTSPGPFEYHVTGSSAVLVEGTLVINGYGTSTVAITQPAYGEYTEATSSLRFVATPTPTPLVSDFSAITKNYGDAPFVLEPHSTSEGDITYTSDDAGIATISSNTVTVHGAGTTNIHLIQAPWGIYLTTTTLAVSLTVNPIPPAITFTDFTRAYDGNAFSIPVTSTSLGLRHFESSNPDVLSVDGYDGMVLASGTTTITLVQDAYGNYTAATSTALVTVPDVCADDACGAYSTSCSIDTHGAACHCVAGVTGAHCSIGIDACASNPCNSHGVCTRTSTLLGASPPLNSHTCRCDTGFYGRACSFVGTQPTPDITFNAITKYLGDVPFHISVTSTSAGTMHFVSSDLAVATVSGDMCTITGLGSSTITLHQDMDGDNYSSSTASTIMTVYENYCTAHANPCQNDGVCSPSEDSFTCSCPPSFSGETCEDSTLNCDGTLGVCNNEGMCIASPSGGSCACGPCFLGPSCDLFDPLCA